MPLAFIGFVTYAVIQFFAIIKNDHSTSVFYGTLEWAGFSIGLVAKIIIALSFIDLLPTNNDILNRKEIASKLDDILGKTFHEIRYPLKSMSTDLNKLLPGDDDKPITNRNEINEVVRRIDSSFNHLAAIIGASYKLYETDIGKPIDNDDELIEIPEYKIETVSINTLIQIAILKIKPFTNEKVEFVCEFASNCYVDCHSYQLVQVFLNLFMNSFEAFDKKSGKISVRTRIKTNNNPSHEPIHKEIEIIVEDSGQGIPIDLQNRIFENGFSTKEASEKRGYGLTIVKQIVESSNGRLIVSEEGSQSLKGACFTIIFPQAKFFPKKK